MQFLVRVRCEVNERFIDESRKRGRSSLFLGKSDEKRRMSDLCFNKAIRVYLSAGGERTDDRFVELIPANRRLTSYFCVTQTSQLDGELIIYNLMNICIPRVDGPILLIIQRNYIQKIPQDVLIRIY